MKRTMKFFLTMMFAAMMVSSVGAAETVWFSLNGPGGDPGAAPANGNNTIPISAAVGTPETLYIWSTAGTPISPTNAYPPQGTAPAPFPANVPPTSAYFAYDIGSTAAAGALSITGGSIANAAIGGAADTNWDGTISGGEVAQRWNAASSFTTAANPANSTSTYVTGLNASSIPTSAPVAGAAVLATNFHTGLIVTPDTNNPGAANTLYNSARSAFLIGSVSFTVQGAGSPTLSVLPSGSAVAGGTNLGIGSGSSHYDPTANAGAGGWVPDTSATTLVNNFNLGAGTTNFAAGTGTVTLNITQPVTGRLGDLNADNAINAADINILQNALHSGQTGAQIYAANPTYALSASDMTNHVVTTSSVDHEVGSLVDINGGGSGGSHGTHYADANLDARVDINDFTTLAQNFGANFGGAGHSNWAAADFNGDGRVDINDFTILAQNFGATGASGAFGTITTVPEPASLALFAFGGFALLAVRRRKFN